MFNYQDDYEILTKLGRGRYSEVFKATNLLTNKDFVVKILKPGKFYHFIYATIIRLISTKYLHRSLLILFLLVKRVKIRREIMILEQLKDCAHIVKLFD